MRLYVIVRLDRAIHAVIGSGLMLDYGYPGQAGV